jgi:hypothetical protein
MGDHLHLTDEVAEGEKLSYLPQATRQGAKPYSSSSSSEPCSLPFILAHTPGQPGVLGYHVSQYLRYGCASSELQGFHGVKPERS